MKTTVQQNDYKFHKPGKRKNNKNWRIDLYKI